MLRDIWKYTRAAIGHIDPILFACTTLLSIISIVTIISAVDNFGKSKLVMQVAMFVVGNIIMLIVANLDYHWVLDKLWLPMLVFSIAILAVTLVAGSSGENMETANKSWLVVFKMGSRKIMIQPSEFVKLTLTCTFAKHLDTVKDRVNHPVTLAGLAVHAGAIVGLIFLSGDYGVALIYAGSLATMLLCAGMSLWYFAGGGAAAVLGFPLAWKYVLKEYHRKRIIVGFNPELDPDDKGWQPLLSKDCIANGGFFGIGLREGGFYEVLTASHTDFIFATICEKYGMAGGTVVIMLLGVMVLRVAMIGYSARGDSGFLICAGVFGCLFFQTLLNVGMCLAVLPVIGITLPFLSCGGSSMLATYIMMGMAHSVASHAPKNQRRVLKV